jgi:hypothetical protein
MKIKKLKIKIQISLLYNNMRMIFCRTTLVAIIDSSEPSWIADVEEVDPAKRDECSNYGTSGAMPLALNQVSAHATKIFLAEVRSQSTSSIRHMI